MAVIRKFLDLSTAHLTVETRQFIDNGLAPGPAYAHPDGYGWFLWVPTDGSDSDPDARDENPVPDDLLAVYKLARDNGCDYVALDCDAPDCDELPIYEEEEATA